MADQKLILEAEARGFDTAASAVGKVSEAQQGLQASTEKAQEAGAESRKATVSQTEGLGQLKTALNQVHPSLGLLVDGFRGLTGVGSLAVATFLSISRALQTVAEEMRKVSSEIEKQQRLLNKLRDEEQRRQQDIENISDRRRRVGGFDAETSRQAVGVAQRIGREFPGLDASAVNEAVGTFGDLGLESDQLAQAAFLLQTGELKPSEGASAEKLRHQLDNAVRRSGTRPAEFLARERKQSDDNLRRAVESIRSTGGETASLRQFIENHPALAGIDAEKLARVTPAVLATEGKDLTLRDLVDIDTFKDLARANLGAIFDRLTGAGGEEQSELQRRAVKLRTEGVLDATPTDVAQTNQVLRALRAATRRLEQTADRQPTTVVNNLQNARFVSPPSARRIAPMNGESHRLNSGRW